MNTGGGIIENGDLSNDSIDGFVQNKSEYLNL